MSASTLRLRALAAAMLAGCLLGSCGLPADDQPHAVDLPRSPLTTPATVTAATEEPGEVVEVLCLVRDGRIVQTVRRVSVLPSAQRQVEHLVAGPTEAERASGLTTALATASLSVEVSPGSTEARVGIAVADESNARSDETIAFGQVVCTLTTRADVNAVVFTRDGDVLQVPRADGSLSKGPLRTGDYASLIGPT